jgi:hypothetical protein
MPGRELTISVGEESRVLRLASGERTELVVPVKPGAGLVPPLRIQADGGEIVDGRTANPRIVAARVLALRFEPAAPGVAS